LTQGGVMCICAILMSVLKNVTICDDWEMSFKCAFPWDVQYLKELKCDKKIIRTESQKNFKTR